MDNRTLAIIGLIGGILAVVGVFGTWVKVSLDEDWEASASGWDFTQGTEIAGPGYSLTQTLKLPYVALVGGILAVVGSVLVFVKLSMVTRALLAIGGILALMGVAFGLHMADVGGAIGSTPLSQGTGYGTYLVVIGGILAVLVTLGLKEEEAKPLWR